MGTMIATTQSRQWAEIKRKRMERGRHIPTAAAELAESVYQLLVEHFNGQAALRPIRVGELLDSLEGLLDWQP
jgi:hypothetical protein